MAKGLNVVVSITVVAFAAVAGILIVNSQYSIFAGTGGAPAEPSDSGTAAVAVEQESADDLKFDGLKSQLAGAQVTGGISPESYDEMDVAIRDLENRGYDQAKTTELRGMLAQLSVGGQASQSSIEEASADAGTESTGVVIWQYENGEWKPRGTPPECPDPLVLQSPVDLDLVSAILYPGQVRGGDFKPHGGFRTDGAAGPIEVRAPIEGYVVDIAKFKDSLGVHYMLDVQHPCGIMYRLGHLSAVPPEIEPIFDGFPEREFGDSRTESVDPAFIAAGATIATDIQHQAGFDWGVYDLRKENGASQDPGFREAHADEPYQAYHAVCWFDHLSAEQETIVRGLPAADGKEGKNSDYC